MAADLDDRPMPLGDHLEELRRRLIWAIGTLVVAFLGAFCFQGQLKLLLLRPLQQAIVWIGPAQAKALGLSAGEQRLLKPIGIEEPIISALQVSFYVALALAFPMLVYQFWAFCAPGLRRSERQAVFWTLPAALIFFYLGLVFGFFIGLPLLYSWMLVYAAADPTVANADLRQTSYYHMFALLTVGFGTIMDIPWLIVVLVRAGLVSAQAIAARRRIIYLIGIILAAILTPPDAVSQILLYILMMGLFELGLWGARWFGPKVEGPGSQGRSA